jgi:DNA polymerase-3 subunit epsilon
VGRILRRAAVAAGLDEGGFIRRVLQRLETSPDTEAGVAAYFDVLDRVLEDRRVTDDEAEALYEVARFWALKPEEVRRAHRRYLRSVVDAALGDGYISGSEHQDLIKVTRLLGFAPETLQVVLEEAQSSCAAAMQLATSAMAAPPSHGLVGKTVCFTGALSGKVKGERITRLMAESLVSSAGLKVFDRVTRGLDILVVADPASQSSKAKAARAFGTRVLAEMELWRQLGVAVE